jgi:AcrR family transcriptional regulator
MAREQAGEPTVDRRVQRTRAALMAAAVRLVSERGTTAIPVTDLTEAANVSRKLLYMHFGDRDALLVAAALDLVERGLAAQVEVPEDVRGRVLDVAWLFAAHRTFYRAMLTGSCAFAMTKALGGLFGALNQTTVRQFFVALDQDTLDDLATFFASGAVAIVNDWLTGGDAADPDELADRLLRVASVLAPHHQSSVTGARAR